MSELGDFTRITQARLTLLTCRSVVRRNVAIQAAILERPRKVCPSVLHEKPPSPSSTHQALRGNGEISRARAESNITECANEWFLPPFFSLSTTPYSYGGRLVWGSHQFHPIHWFRAKKKSSTKRPREGKFVVAHLEFSFRLWVLLVVQVTVQLRFCRRYLMLSLRPKVMVMQVSRIPSYLDQCFRNALVWRPSSTRTRIGARTAYTGETPYICRINTDLATYGLRMQNRFLRSWCPNNVSNFHTHYAWSKTSLLCGSRRRAHSPIGGPY